LLHFALPGTVLRTAFATIVTLLALAGSAGAAPVIDFTADWTKPPAHPSVGQVVTFKGTVSDWDTTEGTVAWNFGEAGATGTGLNPTHTYTTPGLKFVTMTATNGDTPAESTSLIQVLNVNAPPVAGFSWTPTTATTGDEVRFASESDDPDGTIASYDWDFGDGVTDQRRNPVHPFRSRGTKTVKLTVTDAWGATSTITHQVVVADPPVAGPPANKAPIANFAFGPRAPQVGETVDFVSSAVDPDGAVRSQTWDLDGDGQFDDGRGDEVLYTFVSAGLKTVRLRVEDDDGAADVKERTLTVQPGPVAKAGFLRPAPLIRLNGEILSSGSRIRVLSVRAPKTSLVTVKCHGKSCPAQRRRKRVKGGSVRFKTYERYLRAGVKLEIFITKPKTIGSYTRYTIRAGKDPARTDRCLPPGKNSPSRHCG
jgi:PKD repeat protein